MIILAQAAQNYAESNPDAGQSTGLFGSLPISTIWEYIVRISWLQAFFAVAFGAIYFIYGWRVFKMLVVINFTLIGIFVGKYLGTILEGSGLWGGIMGALILGAVSWPFMKYSVSALGGMAGAVIGAALWRSFGLPDHYLPAGALTGLVAGGLLAFSSFKMSIMLFTSLQGSAFLVIGILALLHDYPSFSMAISDAVLSREYLLPLMVVFPTLGGVVFQQYLLRHEEDWAMPD